MFLFFARIFGYPHIQTLRVKVVTMDACIVDHASVNANSAELVKIGIKILKLRTHLSKKLTEIFTKQRI